MILTCPSCQSRYLVPANAVPAQGREVRCKKCSHEWWQYPEIEEIGEEPVVIPPSIPEEDLDPIPESVRPIPQGSGLPAFMSDNIQDATGAAEPRNFYIREILAAFFVFIVIAGLLFGLRVVLIKVWPPIVGLYKMAGVMPSLPGEGLIIDRVEAVAQKNEKGVYTLNVKGTIVNLKNEEISIPTVKASLVRPGGAILQSWLVEVPAEKVKPYGEVEFTTSFAQVASDTKDVTLAFVIKP